MYIICSHYIYYITQGVLLALLNLSPMGENFSLIIDRRYELNSEKLNISRI